MNVPEKDPNFWEQVAHFWPQYVAAGLVGGITWLIRTVFTNQKKLIKLETEIDEREKAAQRGREDVRELKTDIKDMNTHLMIYFSKDKET